VIFQQVEFATTTHKRVFFRAFEFTAIFPHF
jgi:hypothetical protein